MRLLADMEAAYASLHHLAGAVAAGQGVAGTGMGSVPTSSADTPGRAAAEAGGPGIAAHAAPAAPAAAAPAPATPPGPASSSETPATPSRAAAPAGGESSVASPPRRPGQRTLADLFFPGGGCQDLTRAGVGAEAHEAQCCGWGRSQALEEPAFAEGVICVPAWNSRSRRMLVGRRLAMRPLG